MYSNYDFVVEMLRSTENDAAIVKIDSLKNTDGTPDLLAIDVVRAIIVQSKYDVFFVYSDTFADVEEQMNWLNTNVLHHDNEKILKQQMKRRLICASNWKEVFAHPSIHTDIRLVITNSPKEAEFLRLRTKNEDLKVVQLRRGL